MTIKAVFFDLDETLCNTSVSRFERARLMVHRLLQHDALLDEETLVTRALEPHPEWGWPMGALVVDELGLSETEAGREAKDIWFFEGCTHLVQANYGALQVLEVLTRRHKLGVITNGLDEVQRRKFDALRCDGYIHPDVFVTSERAGAYKPDSAIFHFALERLGVSPLEAVHIGDLAHVDVLGAQGAGMRGIWFNPHGLEAPDGTMPDATIRRFDELPAVLAAWA